MRNIALSIGIIVTACSIDHLTVAALDDSNAAGTSASGSPAAAAVSGSAGSGGVVTFAGSSSGGAAGSVLLVNGGAAGSHLIGDLAGEGGLASELRCSCLGQQRPQFCGSDGITYPIECSDGGTCLPPSVDCWHACPCLAGEADAGTTTSWFSVDCAPPAQCTEGIVCMSFSNLAPDMGTCTTTFN